MGALSDGARARSARGPALTPPPPHILPCAPAPRPTPRSFMVLQRKDPEAAKALHDRMDTDIKLRHERLVQVRGAGGAWAWVRRSCWRGRCAGGGCCCSRPKGVGAGAACRQAAAGRGRAVGACSPRMLAAHALHAALPRHTRRCPRSRWWRATSSERPPSHRLPAADNKARPAGSGRAAIDRAPPSKRVSPLPYTPLFPCAPPPYLLPHVLPSLGALRVATPHPHHAPSPPPPLIASASAAGRKAKRTPATRFEKECWRLAPATRMCLLLMTTLDDGRR